MNTSHFDNILIGFSVALSIEGILYCGLGVLLGTIVGVLPGLGTMATLAILMPINFHIEPSFSIIMLAGIYYGAAYGGSTASILMNLPGTVTSVVTGLDGYPMAQNGKAGLIYHRDCIVRRINDRCLAARPVHNPFSYGGDEFRPARIFYADDLWPDRSILTLNRSTNKIIDHRDDRYNFGASRLGLKQRFRPIHI